MGFEQAVCSQLGGSCVVQARGQGGPWPGGDKKLEGQPGGSSDSLLMEGLGPRGKLTPSLWPQELAWFAYLGGERDRKKKCKL